MTAYRDIINHPDSVVRQRWLTSGENEFGQLFQGYGTTEGMDVLDWTPHTKVPQHKKVSYPRYTVNICPEKSEPHQTQITAGGDQLDYHSNVSTHTTSIETIKTHWSSVVSTPNARYCTEDISNMYLCSNLDNAEYIRFPIHLIPPNIIAHYKLQKLISNKYVYARIKKVVWPQTIRENCT